MKKIIKPQINEESEYFCDFSGEKLVDYIPAEVKISCGYGSQYDGFSLNLDLSDAALEELLEFVKNKLSPQTKENLKELAHETHNYLDMAGDARDWDGFNRYANDKEMMEYLAEDKKVEGKDDSLIFSERFQLAKDAEKWCEDNDAKVCPLGIINALSVMGKLK